MECFQIYCWSVRFTDGKQSVFKKGSWCFIYRLMYDRGSLSDAKTLNTGCVSRPSCFWLGGHVNRLEQLNWSSSAPVVPLVPVDIRGLAYFFLCNEHSSQQKLTSHRIPSFQCLYVQSMPRTQLMSYYKIFRSLCVVHFWDITAKLLN